MAKRDYLLRHILIIRKLKSAGEATFKEIAFFLENESEIQDVDLYISLRTFQRDVVEIRKLYNIDIQYDFSRMVYYIEENETEQEANTRLLEAFDMFNILNRAENLTPFLHFEKRKPHGTEHFYGLLHAIKNRFGIRISHQKFWDDKPTERLVMPMALKESQNRWYLVAYDSSATPQCVKTFGLDRIKSIEITKKKFAYPTDFRMNEYFKNCFGIIKPMKGEPEEVVLSIDPEQANFIKTLQLHESQQTLIDNDVEFKIKLKIYITHDFIMELLKYGDAIQVVFPAKLKKQIHQILSSAIKQYQ